MDATCVNHNYTVDEKKKKNREFLVEKWLYQSSRNWLVEGIIKYPATSWIDKGTIEHSIVKEEEQRKTISVWKRDEKKKKQ